MSIKFPLINQIDFNQLEISNDFTEIQQFLTEKSNQISKEQSGKMNDKQIYELDVLQKYLKECFNVLKANNILKNLFSSGLEISPDDDTLINEHLKQIINQYDSAAEKMDHIEHYEYNKLYYNVSDRLMELLSLLKCMLVPLPQKNDEISDSEN